MDGEISIKHQDGAIPHVEPIRCVPHDNAGAIEKGTW